MSGTDFPGGPPSKAGDSGLIRGWGTKIPYAAGQLSPRAANKDPAQPKKKKKAQCPDHMITKEPRQPQDKAAGQDVSPEFRTLKSGQASSQQDDLLCHYCCWVQIFFTS